ncbi:MAG: sel1 repeat family protein [Nitrosomonas sp.]|nr:MAG: sel1 repeat family protein [Nitrosomonas sp.]
MWLTYLIFKRSLLIIFLILVVACATHQSSQDTVQICNSAGCFDRPIGYAAPESSATASNTTKNPQFEALKKLATQDPSAAYDLALRFFRGDGVRQDSYQAIQWMRDAAERGNLKAQMALGRLYLTGLGEMGADPGEAEKWLSITVSRGDKEAATLLKEATSARRSTQARHQWENRWRPNFYNGWYRNYPYNWQWGANQWIPMQPMPPGVMPYPSTPLNVGPAIHNAPPPSLIQ